MNEANRIFLVFSNSGDSLGIPRGLQSPRFLCFWVLNFIILDLDKDRLSFWWVLFSFWIRVHLVYIKACSFHRRKKTKIGGHGSSTWWGTNHLQSPGSQIGKCGHGPEGAQGHWPPARKLSVLRKPWSGVLTYRAPSHLPRKRAYPWETDCQTESWPSVHPEAVEDFLCSRKNSTNGSQSPKCFSALPPPP